MKQYFHGQNEPNPTLISAIKKLYIWYVSVYPIQHHPHLLARKHIDNRIMHDFPLLVFPYIICILFRTMIMK